MKLPETMTKEQALALLVEFGTGCVQFIAASIQGVVTLIGAVFGCAGAVLMSVPLIFLCLLFVLIAAAVFGGG